MVVAVQGKRGRSGAWGGAVGEGWRAFAAVSHWAGAAFWWEGDLLGLNFIAVHRHEERTKWEDEVD